MHNKGHLIVVSGPTCIGKSKLAIKIAKQYNCPILSADSRQLYKEMAIGTAKPSEEEMEGIRHYFVNHISVTEGYSAAKFEEEGNRLLKVLLESHKILVLTGGTGLYINALCEGLDAIPSVDESILQGYDRLFQNEGILPLQNELRCKDPDYYGEVDKMNHRRLIRALSVIKGTGNTFSSYLKQSKINSPSLYSPIYILLEMDRQQLYNRINKRVDIMMKMGLLEEVKKLKPYQNLRSLDTVGYKEIFEYIDGNIDLKEAIRLVKRNTRRYAKRQLTWFRKEEKWKRFRSDDFEGIMEYIETSIS